MNLSLHALHQIIIWALAATAYLCIGEAWVQTLEEHARRRVPHVKHAFMVVLWPLGYLRFVFVWWRTRLKALYGRLRP